jgi:hypothetical protein
MIAGTRHRRQLTFNVTHRLTGHQVKAVAHPLLTAH